MRPRTPIFDCNIKNAGKPNGALPGIEQSVSSCQIIGSVWISRTADATPEVALKPVETGQTAPDFELLNVDGNGVRLGDARGKHVVIVFFRLDFSPI